MPKVAKPVRVAAKPAKTTSLSTTFTLKDVDMGYANAIRRVILAEIPCIAPSFDSYHPELNDFTFHVNTTQLHNEFMGHRIALVPMHFSMTEIEEYDPAAYSFEINVKNTGVDYLDVTSKDIVIYDRNGKLVDTDLRDRIFPPDPVTKDHVLITSLKPNLYKPNEGGHLHVRFAARKGIAKTNARWSCVSQCAFYNAIDEDKSEKARQEAIAKDVPGSSVKAWDTLQKYKHFKVNEYNEPNELIFTIETINHQHDSQQYWGIAIDILVEHINALARNFATRVQSRKTQDVVQLLIKDIDFTIANLLQVTAYNEFVRKGKRETLDFVGYFQPHPLENEMAFKLKFTTSVDVEEFVQDWLAKATANLKALKDKAIV